MLKNRVLFCIDVLRVRALTIFHNLFELHCFLFSKLYSIVPGFYGSSGEDFSWHLVTSHLISYPLIPLLLSSSYYNSSYYITSHSITLYTIIPSHHFILYHIQSHIIQSHFKLNLSLSHITTPPHSFLLTCICRRQRLRAVPVKTTWCTHR